MHRAWGLIVLLCLAREAAARDLYVNNVLGDDLFDASAERPFTERHGPARSISKALRVAQAGDRIVVANTGEPYRESITLQGGAHSGEAHRPFTLQGNGATLDGSVEIPAGAWEHYYGEVFRYRPRLKHYQQLFLAGKPLVRKRIETPVWKLPALEPMEWTIWQGYVYLRTEPGKLPGQYPLTHAGERTGITLYQVRHTAVLDLVVQGFAVDGVNVHDGFGPCYLAGLLCRGNGRSGIAVAGATRVQIEACLLGDNGESQLHVGGLTETYVNNCDLIDGPAPAWRRESGRLYFDGEAADGPEGGGAANEGT